MTGFFFKTHTTFFQIMTGFVPNRIELIQKNKWICPQYNWINCLYVLVLMVTGFVLTLT